MRNDGKAEKQHYIPQFLLRNFTDSKGQLFAYDKWEERSFQTNVKNVAGQRNFYVLDDGSNIEGPLSELETKTAPIIKSIITKESLAELDSNERGILALFLAAQSFRTNQVRETLTHMQDFMEKRIRQMGYDPAQVQGFSKMSDDEIKRMALGMVAQSPKTAVILLQKQWILIKAPSPLFYLADHPIGLHNQRTFGPYGNIGFAVPGVEMYVPLTPTLGLGLLCPSDAHEINRLTSENEYLEGKQKALYYFGATPEIRAKANFVLKGLENIKSKIPTLARSNAMIAAMKAGSAINTIPENIEFMRYLQIRFATRYVYSATNDFDFVAKVLKENPDWKKGFQPRMD